MKDKSGITLIEIIVVVSVIGILVVALGFEFTGWRGRYAVENETRNLYNDLMNARVSAMNRNRDYFIRGANNWYSIYEDTNPWPNGDGILQINSDRPLPEFQRFPLNRKPTEYALCWPGGYTMPVIMNRKGLMSFLVNPSPELPEGAQLRIDPDRNCGDGQHDNGNINADYDCLTIMQATRIKMGKWNVNTDKCDIK